MKRLPLSAFVGRIFFVFFSALVLMLGCSPNYSPPASSSPVSTPVSSPPPPTPNLDSVQSFWSKSAPSLDGNIGGSEWSDAQKVKTWINLVDLNGQMMAYHPFTLYIKNDKNNLYLAGQLEGQGLDGQMDGADFNSLVMDSFSIIFDNNGDGAISVGEDKKSLYIINGAPFVQDLHKAAEGQQEEDEPQDTKGKIEYKSGVGAGPGSYVFEVAIPLNSGDKNDIRLKPGSKVRWNIVYMEKFNMSMTGTQFGGLTGYDSDNSGEWGTLELSTPTSTRVAVEAPAAMASVAAPTKVTRASGNMPKGDINVFAAVMNDSDLSESNLRFTGSHYDMMLVAFPFKHVVDRLRQENPKAKILLFNNPYFAFGDKFWQASSPGAVDQVSEAYSLKTESNETIRYGGPIYEGLDVEQKITMMDITNPAWQDYFATQSRKHVDACGYDGVFIDTLTEDIPPFAVAPGNKYPKGYTKEKWKEGNYQFLRKVTNAFKGSSSLVMFNGITRSPGTHPSGPPNTGMLKMVEGAAIEAYSVYKSLDSSNKSKQWYFHKTILGDLKQAADQGKWMVIEVYGDRDDDQLRLYALSSFLMVQSERIFFYFTRKDQAGALHWRPEWSVRLGNPTGSYQKGAGGVYLRNFEKGRVLVNPTSKSVTWKVKGAYKNWATNAPATSLDMPPYSGALLLAN